MINPKEQSLDKVLFKKLTRLYIIALSLIAISIVISHLIIDSQIRNKKEDSFIINISGRQRMLSQKLSKEVLLLQKESFPSIELKLVQSLSETLQLWSTSHELLQEQSNSVEVIKLYENILPYYNSIVTSTNKILQGYQSANKLSSELLEARVAQINLDEKLFLQLMDQIVNQYEVEANQKLSRLRLIELVIFGLTLCLLLLEFLLVYKPTASYVESVISKLIKAEEKAIAMAYNADQLSEAKEASVKELRALNYAMNQTLLFSRVTPTGEVIYMGGKFSRLFRVKDGVGITRWSHVLTSDNKERAFVEEVINTNNQSGWQGQFKISQKSGGYMWLDTTMIPVNVSGGKSELLIICLDVTARNMAQLEVERLNKERFYNEMNQQKILSSKIVENQENEQNRIAKEIHDGIGQMLTGLKFSLESIDLSNIEKTEEKITYLKGLSAAIIKGVRTATFNLMPPELKDHGVASSLLRMTQELTKLTGKEIVFINKSDFNNRLDSLTEINLYRVTQEAINNAIKYANSKHIVVMLSHSLNILSVTVDDDGDGFDLEEAKVNKNSESGMGMEFMKERINYINGRLFLHSSIGEGTHLTINVPI